jgi:hypothetical protein
LVIVRGGLEQTRRVMLTIARPVVPAQRNNALQLGTAPVPGAHSTSVAADAVWIHGEQIPAGAWVEVRTERSGPKYFPLEETTRAPPSLGLWVSLEEAHVLTGVARGPQEEPAAGALVTLFRLISPPTLSGDPSHDRPRRVFGAERIAGPAGEFHFDGLGEADYELVAWHPQLGRGALTVPSGGGEVTVRIASEGQVRGRIVSAGRPVAGADVISLPDLESYARAGDLIDVKGGDGRSGKDGRFIVTVAPGGGGELRIGGGVYPVKRIPLPRVTLPLLDVGDLDLGSPIDVTVALDHDPGCDLRSVGPLGRAGLQVVGGTRHGPGLFRLVFPEEGAWVVQLVCGREERALVPAVVSITQSNRGKELALSIRD